MLVFTTVLLQVSFAAIGVVGCGDCWCVVNSTASCPAWRPANYTQAEIADFRAVPPAEPAMTLIGSCNPYKNSSCHTSPSIQDGLGPATVCGVQQTRLRQNRSCTGYTLRSFESKQAAFAGGYSVTHSGACGLCSGLGDLATYMAIKDMTKVGKRCGVEAVISMKTGIKCFHNLGFSVPCAEIWAYDAVADAKPCGGICLRDIRKPYNIPPACQINDCLQCDEEKSGPIFKRFAARTRRRSGLISAIQRPCESVARLVHEPCTPGTTP